MTITISDLTFDAIIGILDHERLTPQRVIVDTAITYSYAGEFINYADVAEHIKNEVRRKQFELIEEALESLRESLKTTFPRIETLTLQLSKPDILADCRVSVSETYKF